jgi:hypothetical protein
MRTRPYEYTLAIVSPRAASGMFDAVVKMFQLLRPGLGERPRVHTPKVTLRKDSKFVASKRRRGMVHRQCDGHGRTTIAGACRWATGGWQCLDPKQAVAVKGAAPHPLSGGRGSLTATAIKPAPHLVGKALAVAIRLLPGHKQKEGGISRL